METVQIKDLLSTSASVIRALQQDKEKLASRVAGYERQELADEIVTLMEERGQMSRETPYKQKLASVLASNKDLQIIKQALLLAPIDMSFASVSELPGQGNNSSEDLLAFLAS